MCSIKQKERKTIKKTYNISSVFYFAVVKNFTVLTKQSNKMFVSNNIVSNNSRIGIQIFQQQKQMMKKWKTKISNSREH